MIEDDRIRQLCAFGKCIALLVLLSGSPGILKAVTQPFSAST